MPVVLLFAACVLYCGPSSASSVYEHAVYESQSLDGAWEMAYSPYEWESKLLPEFSGVTVPNAIPGYWEDMVSAFRAAGMKDEFRINPWYEKQTLPVTGWAMDTMLPDIYGTFFYRRTFEVKSEGVQAPAVLRFEGVRNQVYAWVNGRFVAFHVGFSTPFELKVPKGVLRKSANEIVLAVSNCRNLGYCDYVVGLTTRNLFRSTGGVNGKLELRFPANDLGDVYVTTARDLKTFTLHVAGTTPYEYEIAEKGDGGERTVRKGRATGDAMLPTEGLTFWSPENPKRYELRLTTAGGTCRQMFGLRRLTAEGEKLFLNGRPVYLRGVTEHCYFARTVHVPRDLDYYRMITAKRKELGFNFVRFHTFVPPAEYLEAADELGMLVHVESPNFVSVPEYSAIIAFARRHPSVVIYCTGNETRIDRLAETYLEDVAGLVHKMTDSLFSPMSALRAVEYALHPTCDKTVPEPFEHNAERMARIARYGDLWTSYQLGLTSYNSLNSEGAETLDRWGDAYCGKPRLSHETCIDGSYADLSLEALYPANSPIVKAGVFSEVRRVLKEKGLLDRSDLYFRNSCEWMRRIRKFTFEKTRAADRVAGFDFLGDINTHWHTFGYSVGMMDEFYRLKPGETVENVLRYNSAAVLLTDLGSDFVVTAGEKKRVAFKLSNFVQDVTNGCLEAGLYDAKTGECVSMASASFPDRIIRNGKVTELETLGFLVPDDTLPRKYLLKAKMANLCANEWEIYAFPKVKKQPAPASVKVVTDISKADLLAAMSRGERILLFGAGPFKSLPMTYRIGMAGRCSGNFATVVKDHPIFRDFPNEGYCSWAFRRLMEGGRAVQLEAGVPFDPIVDVASAVKFPIRQAALFEYRVGEGRLLVCSFAFRPDDPAAEWLKARLVDYAASESFVPALRLSPDELKAVVDAPLLQAAGNPNVAKNNSDPSSDVRAGALAQP